MEETSKINTRNSDTDTQIDEEKNITDNRQNKKRKNKISPKATIGNNQTKLEKNIEQKINSMQRFARETKNVHTEIKSIIKPSGLTKRAKVEIKNCQGKEMKTSKA